jgi:hypothetical protein
MTAKKTVGIAIQKAVDTTEAGEMTETVGMTGVWVTVCGG